MAGVIAAVSMGPLGAVDGVLVPVFRTRVLSLLYFLCGICDICDICDIGHICPLMELYFFLCALILSCFNYIRVHWYLVLLY